MHDDANISIDLRFGVSTLRSSLDVESVESSVTDRDGSRKSEGQSNSRSSSVNSTIGSVGHSEVLAISSTVLSKVSLDR